jgi:hypothetical protein
MWKRVLPAGGARLVEASVVRRGPELEDGFECEYLLATHGGSAAPAWVRKTVRELVSRWGLGGVGGVGQEVLHLDRFFLFFFFFHVKSICVQGLPIVTREWAIDCLIHNRRLPFDLHPSYHIEA